MSRAQCHMCRRGTGDDQFCNGCRVYICAKCDVNLCTGKHVPVDHVRQLPGEYHGESK